MATSTATRTTKRAAKKATEIEAIEATVQITVPAGAHVVCSRDGWDCTMRETLSVAASFDLILNAYRFTADSDEFSVSRDQIR